LALETPKQDEAAERPGSLAARVRVRIVGLVRAVPIRWRILSIAALNSAVVMVLAVMIWNGAGVLGSAWDDVRQVRESDKILARLESETGRLHNLIHRYINQPSSEIFSEILLLRERVLDTLTSHASKDPMLAGSAGELKRVIERLLEGFGELRRVQAADRAALLRNAIDASQADAIGVIDELSIKTRQREQKAQETFDRTLGDISRKVLSIAVIFLGIIITAGVVIALSIRLPLQQIMAAMHAITSGDYDSHVQGTRARDEVGAMARAVEVFRENAIAKRDTEDELRTSKEKAESALLELNTAQQNLIDAERLAALGSLVAGVAHEVNNPIGISLTVASSFARRAEMFEAEMKSDTQLRRSRLEEFVRTSRDAAHQLVANLHRAGELIQSFKQVAVDRSHAERRQFALCEATDQIVASLRPVLKKAAIALSLDVPDGLVIDGYPGSYGQILTNLFLNAANHAFADGRSGTISISARPRGHDEVEIIFADNGAGMTPDVQRQAFDPFFTTRRNEGGTGLGLHIVYNLVTQQLGGRMMLDSRLGQGTTFRIIMPRAAKGGSVNVDLPGDGTAQWPTRTMSSI
jgi:signal transduction histidine kinase